MRFFLLFVCVCQTYLFATPQEYKSGIPSLDALLKAGLPEGQEVVGMTGFYGQDQPKQWLILAKNQSDGALTEYVVAGEKVAGKRKLHRLPNQAVPSIVVDRERLKVDSKIAFEIAEFQARQERVAYDSVHYQLRCREEMDEPVWAVNLLDPVGKSIGIHYISAESGVLLRSVWHRSSREALTKTTVDRDGEPVSLLYGAKVTELTVSGKANAPKRLKRTVEPVAAK